MTMSAAPQARADAQKSQASGIAPERALARFAVGLEGHAAGYQAVVAYISRLQPRFRTRAFRGVARTMMRGLTTDPDDRYFELHNHDAVVICRGKNHDAMSGVLDRVRGLVGDDALFGDGEASDALGMVYDLVGNLSGFTTECKRLLAEAVTAGPDAAGEPLEPLDATHLNRIEASLRATDLSRFFRRQPICAIEGKAPPRPLYDELYFSVPDVGQAILPRFDLTANPWLFRHLTATLDEHMLALLTRPKGSPNARACSINLNIASIHSRAFLEFVTKWSVDGEILQVELDLADVFSHLEDFALVRYMAREAGFHVCLDGITATALPFLDFERLQCQRYKLRWEAGLDRQGAKAQGDLAAAIARAGPERLILCHCDQGRAVTWGRTQGLTQYQGWYLDKALKKLAS